MTLNKCTFGNCRVKLRSKRHARNHYNKHHSGEIETPEEYLNRVESEQRGFNGDIPDTEGHNPEYLTENDRPEEGTRKASLFEFERDKDGCITECSDTESEEKGKA